MSTSVSPVPGLLLPCLSCLDRGAGVSQPWHVPNQAPISPTFSCSFPTWRANCCLPQSEGLHASSLDPLSPTAHSGSEGKTVCSSSRARALAQPHSIFPVPPAPPEPAPAALAAPHEGGTDGGKEASLGSWRRVGGCCSLSSEGDEVMGGALS